MLTGIHFLLTYSCNFECDHCFLYCGPHGEGTFTLEQIKKVLDDARNIETMEWIYFEGGEPFLYYPIMIEGLKLSREMGYKAGVVTNCYWATTEEDASVWLRPIVDAGIADLSMSDDKFHHGDVEETPARKAASAAEKLGAPAGSICIEEPTIKPPSDAKGDPVIGGGALFKGRAADKLTEGLPTRPQGDFCECSHEELAKPKRVHIDSFGNVQVCQGISIGNMWKKPISRLIMDYDAERHPICGPLVKGGPAELAREYGIEFDTGFVDECHLCYTVRRKLRERFPQYLAPPQVYGVTSGDA